MESLSQTFIEAGTLMLAGMVFVFTFLGILIIFINGVLKPLSKKYPDPVPQTRKPVAKSNPVTGGVQPQVVAAISAAVSQYRKQQ